MKPHEYLQRVARQDEPIVFDEAEQELGEALPLLRELRRTPQDARWHAEGDVAIHTRMVLEALEEQLELAAEVLDARQRFVLRLAALLHDIAKPITTRAQLMEGEERIVAPRHAQRGAAYLPLKLAGLGVPTRELMAAVALVRHHHDPKHHVIKDRPDPSFHQLARLAWMRGLFYLEQADMRGRTCEDKDEQVGFIDLFGMRCEETQTWEDAWDVGASALEARFIRPVREALTQDAPDFVERAVVEGLYALDAGEIFTPEEAIARAYKLRERHTELVVLCGPSGAGKSTWAARRYPGHRVISMDALREEIAGDRADQSENGRVFQAAQEQLKEALRACQPVIWDATCLRHDTRRKLLELGRDYGAHTTLAAFLTPPATLERQNKDRAHPVPAHILSKQLDGFEWPGVEEAHRLIIVAPDGEHVRNAAGRLDGGGAT